MNNTIATGSCSPHSKGLGKTGKAFVNGSESEDLPSINISEAFEEKATKHPQKLSFAIVRSFSGKLFEQFLLTSNSLNCAKIIFTKKSIHLIFLLLVDGQRHWAAQRPR